MYIGNSLNGLPNIAVIVGIFLASILPRFMTSMLGFDIAVRINLIIYLLIEPCWGKAI